MNTKTPECKHKDYRYYQDGVPETLFQCQDCNKIAVLSEFEKTTNKDNSFTNDPSDILLNDLNQVSPKQNKELSAKEILFSYPVSHKDGTVSINSALEAMHDFASQKNSIKVDDKQPQTVYIKKESAGENVWIDAVENVYIYTPSELSSLIAEKERIAAEKGWDNAIEKATLRSGIHFSGVKELMNCKDKNQFLNTNYPINK